MEFMSFTTDEYTIYAVSESHAASFKIDFNKDKTEGLIGFIVERKDLNVNEQYLMKDLKLLNEILPVQSDGKSGNSFENQIRSFVWYDFSIKPGTEYEYNFFPLRGTFKNQNRSAEPIVVKINTECEFPANKLYN